LAAACFLVLHGRQGIGREQVLAVALPFAGEQCWPRSPTLMSQPVDGPTGRERGFLNDQLAAGMLWREMARRSQRSNSGTELGEALAGVSAEIAEDVETFQRIMRRLGIRLNPVKIGLAVGAERLGRLKLNGRLGTYSPLSRFVELEFLAMGIEGKKLLWKTLRDLAGLASRLPDVDFDHLIERAERQRADLEPFRVQAGTEALGSSSLSLQTTDGQ
jgi:hypothetical protein